MKQSKLSNFELKINFQTYFVLMRHARIFFLNLDINWMKFSIVFELNKENFGHRVSVSLHVPVPNKLTFQTDNGNDTGFYHSQNLHNNSIL